MHCRKVADMKPFLTMCRPKRALLRQYHDKPGTTEFPRPRRAYLYVPSSSERMLQKSLQVKADTIIYDLEDSVAPSQKAGARQNLIEFLQTKTKSDSLPEAARIAVRVNAVTTPFFEEDIAAAVQNPSITSVILPKVHSAEDLDVVSEAMAKSATGHSDQIQARGAPMRLIASVESARSLWRIGDIAGWRSRHNGGGVMAGLLFAAEDYCADASIIRTPTRTELLYTRSRIVIAAKTFGLEAIDMVCVNYKDIDYLRDEAEDARRLGFSGKQAIHPDQVDIIQETFLPTAKEVLRATRIVHQMEKSHEDRKGAFGLEDGKGGKEMIDAPMLLQAENTLRLARAAGMTIPTVD